MRKGVRVEERKKAKREDVESSPTDHEGRTSSSFEGILSPRRAWWVCTEHPLSPVQWLSEQLGLLLVTILWNVDELLGNFTRICYLVRHFIVTRTLLEEKLDIVEVGVGEDSEWLNKCWFQHHLHALWMRQPYSPKEQRKGNLTAFEGQKNLQATLVNWPTALKLQRQKKNDLGFIN